MIISLDTEYSSLDPKTADLLSVSIGTSSDEFLFKPHQLAEVASHLYKAEIVFMQNGIVDCVILARHGITIDKTKILDTMLLEHLIDENIDHDLGSMAVRYFQDNYKSEAWAGKESFLDFSPEEADSYERKDARYTYDLGVRFLEQLKDKIPLIKHVHRLHWTLCDIEEQGICVDTELIKITEQETRLKIESLLPKLREEFHDYCEIWEMQEWEKEIEKRKTIKGKSGVVRPVFSFASDSQLRALLYGPRLLGLSTESKTKSGSPSTDYDTLTELAESHPEIQSIVDYKREKAVYSTFMKGLLERVVNDKVHPHFSVNGTTTGRLSSSNPNFQNMPQDGVIRNFILPDPGHLLVAADYSSLEVFVEGNLTNDPQLLKIMLEGADKHSITAEAVGMSRKDAKTLNFLCQYGGGVWKIQKTFGVTEKVAQEIYDKYWKAYSGVMAYKQQVFKELADTGQVVNRFGRARHFPKPTNKWEKEKFERQAYSHMVQGPGAEMTNYATYTLDTYLRQNSMGRVIMCIHDELVCSIKKDLAESAKSDIVSIMESANDILSFKHRVKAVPYGPLERWAKL